MVMAKKLFLILLFSLILSLSIFAESYVIRSYSFDISGKTQKWVVENLVVAEEEEVFSSLEEVESALSDKQQALLNKRVFKSVEYSYSLETVEDVTYVDASFIIVDARTVLVLPYPKYDSNYGLRLGIKYWNRNVLGTFSSMDGTVHVTFNPGDFENAKYFADFEIKNLLIGQTAISASVEGNAKQSGGVSDYNASLSVNNIVIASKFSLNLGFGFKNSGSEFIYSASSSFEGLGFGDVGFSPSISATVYEKSRSSSYITPSLSTTGIRIGSVNLSFKDYVKFKNSEKFTVNHYYHSMTLSFSEGKLSSYGYSHSFTYYPKSSLTFANTVSYKLSDATTILFYENLKWTGENFFFSSFDSGVGIRQTIHIGEHITVTPTLSQYVTAYNNGDNSGLLLQPYYSLSASSSGNYINWKGNFREGISYSFSISESWYQNYVTRTPRGTYADRIELQLHKILWGWFNPSVRILGSYTNDITGHGSATGTAKGDYGEYIRGVRNQSVIDDGRNRNLLSLIVNVNLLTEFPLPSFMNSWLDAYLNVFCDYAFTKHGTDASDENVKRSYLGFGIEAIGVLKEFPSYPVRASLGFDFRKLASYVKGESESRDFYELYVGLDFFF